MDVVGALIAILKADPAVPTDNILGGTLPRDINKSLPEMTVVLRRAGGPQAASYERWSNKRVDVDCLGADDKEASDLWDAVYATLRQLRRTVQDGVLIHRCDCTADGTSFVDPVATWPICAGTFMVTAADVAA